MHTTKITKIRIRLKTKSHPTQQTHIQRAVPHKVTLSCRQMVWWNFPKVFSLSPDTSVDSSEVVAKSCLSTTLPSLKRHHSRTHWLLLQWKAFVENRHLRTVRPFEKLTVNSGDAKLPGFLADYSFWSCFFNLHWDGKKKKKCYSCRTFVGAFRSFVIQSFSADMEAGEVEGMKQGRACVCVSIRAWRPESSWQGTGGRCLSATRPGLHVVLFSNWASFQVI